MVTFWRALAAVIFLACLGVAARGLWRSHLNREVVTPGGISVYPGRYHPDLDFLDDKYFKTCKCLGRCKRNFVVEIVTDDNCFSCPPPASSSGYCRGMTGFKGDKAYVFLTEDLRSAAWEVVRTQHKDRRPDLLHRCGKAIDDRMNKEHQRIHGEWPRGTCESD